MSSVLVSNEVLSKKFTKKQIDRIYEWFTRNSKHSEEGPDTITLDQLQEFLAGKPFHKRSFKYPSYGELMLEMEHFKAGVTRVLTLDQTLYILIKNVLEPDIKHELYLAFSAFDTENRGFIEVDELESIVTFYGDVFTKDEVREMMRDANVRGDGNIYYKDFIDSIFALSPNLRDIKVEYLYTNPNEDPSVEPDSEEEKEKPDELQDKDHVGEIDEKAIAQLEEEQSLTTKEKVFTGEETLNEKENSVTKQEPPE